MLGLFFGRAMLREVAVMYNFFSLSYFAKKWGTVAGLNYIFAGFVQQGNVKKTLDAGKHLIININQGKHWVLAKGYSGDTIYVNDPGYQSKTSYELSEIVNSGSYSPRSLTIKDTILALKSLYQNLP